MLRYASYLITLSSELRLHVTHVCDFFTGVRDHSGEPERHVLTITAHTTPMRLGRTYGTLLVDLDGAESVKDPIL